MRQIGHPEQLDGQLEGVGVGGVEQVELRVAGDGNPLQDDEGSSDEREVVGHEEGVLEEHLVQVVADRHELLPPLDHGLVLAGLDLGGSRLLHDGQLGAVEDLLQLGLEFIYVDVLWNKKKCIKKKEVIDMALVILDFSLDMVGSTSFEAVLLFTDPGVSSISSSGDANNKKCQCS